MRVREFERAVWRVDRLCLLVRAPKEAMVQDFDLAKGADQGMTLAGYFKIRIAPRISGYEFAVVDGSGQMPNGNTKIGNLRQSYAVLG